MNKIQIESIRFTYSESEDIKDSPFSNWEDAEKALSKVIPPDIGYYKTGFEIIWQDGETYKGRYDIGSDEPTLKNHILGFWKRFLEKNHSDKEAVEEVNRFLETYQIG